MGDRFLLVRPHAGGRRAAGIQAMRNVSSEVQMRTDLAQITGKLLVMAAGRGPVLTDAENESILDLADLIAWTRTAVARSFNGQPEFAHAPEMPTRIAKQMVQLARGGLALGMTRDQAMAVVERCAADTMPPLRLRLLADVAANPDTATADVVTRTQLTRMTVDRGLQELQLLGLLTMDSVAYGSKRTRWIYTLAENVSRDALARLRRPTDKSGQHATGDLTDIPGQHAGSPMLPRNVSAPSGDGRPEMSQLPVPASPRENGKRQRCAKCPALELPKYLTAAGLCKSCEIQTPLPGLGGE
jgi:hypothetical protein